jgi:hypothetical protein
MGHPFTWLGYQMQVPPVGMTSLELSAATMSLLAALLVDPTLRKSPKDGAPILVAGLRDAGPSTSVGMTSLWVGWQKAKCRSLHSGRDDKFVGRVAKGEMQVPPLRSG